VPGTSHCIIFVFQVCLKETRDRNQFTGVYTVPGTRFLSIVSYKFLLSVNPPSHDTVIKTRHLVR